MKTFWNSLKAIEGDPEYHENLGKEFPSPPEQSPPSELQRREFLKLMGAGFMLGTLGCMRKPVEKIIPYVNQPIEVTPGVANWYSSTCGGCAAGCGVVVKTREGRPIKLEGNPEHPLNRGALCARGQASLLGLYDPDRLQSPMRVARGHDETEAVTWAAVDEQILAALQHVREIGKKVVVLSGAVVSPTTRRLIQEFLGTFSSAEHVSFDITIPEEVAEAQMLAYGERVMPRYRFDQADVVVSFGADFLGTWLSPVAFARDFSKLRRAESGRMSRLIAFEGGLSLTGTNADVYQPVRAGDEIYIALALAHELIVKMSVTPYAANDAVVQALTPFDVDRVAAYAGVSAEVLRATAKDLWKQGGKSLVVGGGNKGRHAVALQVVVNLLNSALGNDGSTVDWSVAPHEVQSSFAGVQQLIADMRAGNVGAVIIHQADPLFTLPTELGFAEALAKVPLVVSTAERTHATAMAAHWICPDSHYLESWNDANPQRGLYSITQPAIAPFFATRQFQDSLIVWGKLPAKNWYEYLKAHFSTEIRNAVGATVGGETFWDTVLQNGFAASPAFTVSARSVQLAAARSLNTNALSTLPTALPAQSNAVRLALYASVTQLDGRCANNGWLQEIPDPVTKVTWGNYLSIAPKTAARLGVTDGDVVKVTVGKTSVELPIHRQPKLHAGTAMVAVGHGQSKIGRIGSQVGANVYPLQGVNGLPVWSGQDITIEKTGRFDKLAMTQEYNTVDGRPIIFDTTFADFQNDPTSGMLKAHALPTMWSEHEYPDEKWGMAIDLTTCIGCNACMVGCQSENNVPIVGREQVIRNRDMHWLRIDRYYAGDVDNPEVVYQPMLCQHCDNAPCETVCPVVATVHSKDGLNVQAYNRCVGTRYCSNNCPYKVRRFNYFEYSKQYVEPLEMVLNPDVAVRSRGVMEKCTFCVQRIKDARGRAKDEGRKLQAGDVKTACQQTCPVDAIVFGDMNNSEELVAQLRKSPRGFHVLGELNTKPNVTYMTKVRNT